MNHHVFARTERVADFPGTERVRVTLVCRRNPAHDHADLVRRFVETPVQARAPWEDADFDRRFAALGGELDAVRKKVQDLGFVVTDAGARDRLVSFEGEAAAVERAFGVDLALFDVNGRRHRGHVEAPALPPGLAGMVEAVLGLDDLPAVRGPRAAGEARPGKHTYTPQQLMEFYRFPAADGSGERIALVQMGGGFDPHEVAQYFTELKVRRQPAVVHGSNQPSFSATLKALVAWMNGDGPQPADANAPAERWSFETTMDVELAGAFAPGAALDVHFAGANTSSAALRVLRQAVHARPRPSVISCSWALGLLSEMTAARGATGGKGLHALVEDTLQEAALLGITVCVASGDAGSAPGGHGLDVEYPAASVYALACGGTTVHAEGARPASETVWNATTAGLRFASGGGLVPAIDGHAAPSWQKGALAAWLATRPAGVAAKTTPGRGVPDVAGSADFNAGCRLLVGGLTTRAGGTSASAPVWAALIARLNAALRAKGRHPLGLAMPAFYDPSVRHAFTKITRGHNNLADPAGAYQASPHGWDPCTGLGTPKGEELLAALLAG